MGALKQRTCFVIMPFGKKDAPGSVAEGGDLWGIVGLSRREKRRATIDFDKLYEDVIVQSMKQVAGYHIECVRCDEIPGSGSIHQRMIERIAGADIAVVELTTLNPNVFYELGVRHALRRGVTVLIQQQGVGERVPFNIGGQSVVKYDPGRPEVAREAIRRHVEASLKDREHRDSLVFQTLGQLKVEVSRPRRMDRREFHHYALQLAHGKDCQIGVITGDVAAVRGVDIWVNSENTEMMMARYHERAISATIRYLGAVKNQADHVSSDVIALELDEAMRAAGATSVPPGGVVVTGSGALEQTRGVKWIFHAASVVGQVGGGYTPIADVGACVTNALVRADSVRFRAEHEAKYGEGARVRSILFPIFGTGQAGADFEDAVADQMRRARAYLEQTPDSSLDRVYFLAFTDRDRAVCKRVLEYDGLECSECTVAAAGPA